MHRILMSGVWFWHMLDMRDSVSTIDRVANKLSELVCHV